MYPDPTTFGFCNSEEKKKTKNERKGRGQRKKRRRKGSDHLLATHYWCLLLPSLSLSLSLSLARARAKKEREGEKKTFCFQKDGKKRESSQCRFMVVSGGLTSIVMVTSLILSWFVVGWYAWFAFAFACACACAWYAA